MSHTLHHKYSQFSFLCLYVNPLGMNWWKEFYIISYTRSISGQKDDQSGRGVLNLDATGLICDLSVQPRHIANYMCIAIIQKLADVEYKSWLISLQLGQRSSIMSNSNKLINLLHHL